MASSKQNQSERELKAVETKRKWSRALQQYKNVTGVGLGLKVKNGKITNIISIRVYVTKKLPPNKLKREDLLPKSVDNLPIDVIEARFEAHINGAIIAEHRVRQDPMWGGLSIGNLLLGGSGTLGASVYDNVTGQGMILSNWHVLCGRNGCAAGEIVIQPGQGGGDTGTGTDIVARLERAVISNRVDGAIARLTGNRFLQQEVLGFGTVQSITNATLGMSVRKSGRTTGLTFGSVTDISAEVSVGNYSDGTHHFIEQIIIEGGLVSNPGDSGSLWLDDSNRAVGLNFAGSNGTMAIANPIGAVLSELNINFHFGVTMQDFHIITSTLLY